MFNGMFGITKLSDAETRSISAENVYGEKGRGGMAQVSEVPQPEVEKIGQVWDGPNQCARELGAKWKVRPCITLPEGIDYNDNGHRRAGYHPAYMDHG